MNRVCIVSSGLRIGGVERKITDLAQYIASAYPANRVAVDLILEVPAAKDGSENIFLRLTQETGCRILFKPVYVPLLPFLLWYVMRHKPDTMLAFSRRPGIFTLTARELLRWRKWRVILGSDSIASQILAWFNPEPWRRRLIGAQMRRLYPRADLILVPSDMSKDDLVSNFGVPPEKIRVFKNWTRYVQERDAVKTIDLIYVGRVDGLKQLTRLVEIARAVREKIPSLRVTLVGDGADMENVRRAVYERRMEDAFEFAGFQSDIGKYLAEAKIFCLTSQFEGMPLAALEAMAYGLPVVTTAYPGARELVQAGETGFVCANDREYGDALTALLSDDARRAAMGERARTFVRREHGLHILGAYAACLVEPD